MKSLVEAECGGSNDLVALAHRVGGSSTGSQRLQPQPRCPLLLFPFPVSPRWRHA